MMIRALNTIALVVAVVLAFALYKAKTEAHVALERLDELAVRIEDERRASAVLRAEIAFLERPERLRALAARHLGLEPTDPEREVTLEDTLLALGVADPGAVRFADLPAGAAAPDAAFGPAPVAVAVAAAEMPEDPIADLIQDVTLPAAIVAVAALEPVDPPSIGYAAEPGPAPVAVAELAPVPEAEVNVLPPAEDPIASLIIAAGGLQ